MPGGRSKTVFNPIVIVKLHTKLKIPNQVCMIRNIRNILKSNNIFIDFSFFFLVKYYFTSQPSHPSKIP